MRHYFSHPVVLLLITAVLPTLVQAEDTPATPVMTSPAVGGTSTEANLVPEITREPNLTPPPVAPVVDQPSHTTTTLGATWQRDNFSELRGVESMGEATAQITTPDGRFLGAGFLDEYRYQTYEHTLRLRTGMQDTDDNNQAFAEIEATPGAEWRERWQVTAGFLWQPAGNLGFHTSLNRKIFADAAVDQADLGPVLIGHPVIIAGHWIPIVDHRRSDNGSQFGVDVLVTTPTSLILTWRRGLDVEPVEDNALATIIEGDLILAAEEPLSVKLIARWVDRADSYTARTFGVGLTLRR